MANNPTGSDDLFRMVADCSERANHDGRRFNIFRILGMHRNEQETHSRFLYELLNPGGKHGEGDTFLNSFLKDVFHLKGIEAPFSVSREFPTEENRRIDLVIESKQYVIGIELKIDAADQNRQLYDYYGELKHRAQSHKKVKLAYLTLQGRKSTSKSYYLLDKEIVFCISFSSDISAWLEKCAEKSMHKPLLMSAIQQYLQLIRDLTGKGGSVSELIARELQKDSSHFEKALAIENALPAAKSAIQLRFWEDLRKSLSSQAGCGVDIYGGDELKPISDRYYSKDRNNKNIGIKVRVCDLGTDAIYLYVNLYQCVHYGLRVENRFKEVIAVPEVRKAFRERCRCGNAVADKNENWLVCYYFNPASENEERIIDFHNFNDAARSVINDDARSDLIDGIVNHSTHLVGKAREFVEQRDN